MTASENQMTTEKQIELLTNQLKATEEQIENRSAQAKNAIIERFEHLSQASLTIAGYTDFRRYMIDYCNTEAEREGVTADAVVGLMKAVNEVVTQMKGEAEGMEIKALASDELFDKFVNTDLTTGATTLDAFYLAKQAIINRLAGQCYGIATEASMFVDEKTEEAAKLQERIDALASDSSEEEEQTEE